MGKKFLLFTFFILCLIQTTASAHGFILEYDGASHEYTGSVFSLTVNNTVINPPMPPIIFNDYALVPVREIFESLGATVKYIDLTKEIYIQYDDTNIRLQIGNPKATVGTDEVTIPGNITPKLIAFPGEPAKTMVPVRFVSESIGLFVDFDQNNGIIKLSNKAPEPSINLYNLNYYAVDSKTTVVNLNFSDIVENYSKPILTTSNVLYFDIPDTKYIVSNLYELMSGPVKKVRLGQHGNYMRVALDLDNSINYDIISAYEGRTITVTVSQDKSSDKIPVDNSQSTTPSPKPTPPQNTEPPKNEQKPQVTEKIVVLDAGHGGQDPGAIGTLNEKEILEKDLNLAMTLAVKDILTSNGIHVELTREGDTYPTLNERAIFANEKQAVIFVSIHANSATSANASGYEVYYSEINNSDNTGITSKELAKAIISKISDNVTTRNRGVKTADHVVTRSCIMPAVLIEVGFISNESELELMLSDDYRNKFARGVADGIMNVYNSAQIPQPTPQPVQAETVSE